MPEQNPAVTEPVAAAEPEGTARRSAQRAALRDLVALATECATTEAEIDQQYHSSLEEEEKRYKRAVWEAAQRAETAKKGLGLKQEEVLTKVEARYQEGLARLESLDSGARQQIHREFGPAEQEIKKQFEQAKWLADNVFELAQAQIKDDAKKVKEEVEAVRSALDAMEAESAAILNRYGQSVLPFKTPVPGAEGSKDAAAAAAALTARLEESEKHIRVLRDLSLPRLFVGATPWLILALMGAVGGVAGFFIGGGAIGPAAAGSVALMVLGVILGFALRIVAQKQVAAAYLPLNNSISEGRQAALVRLEAATFEQQARYARAFDKRQHEIQGLKDKFSPHLVTVTRNRDAAHQVAKQNQSAELSRLRAEREQGKVDAEEALKLSHHALKEKVRAEHESARRQHEGRIKAIETRYNDSRAALERRLSEGLVQTQAPMARTDQQPAPTPIDWADPAWKNWKPPQKFPAEVRFGELQVDLRKIADAVPRKGELKLQLPPAFSVPAFLAFPNLASLLIQTGREGREMAMSVVQMAMTRLLTSLPPGRVKFTIIDPVGLGQNFAGFMHLADYDETLVGTRIWTDAEQIEQRLSDLTDHMETVIQKYLRNEFATIDDYNAQAGELAEPYRVLVVSDFPVGFDGDSFRRLSSIASSGARCGVYTIIARDTRVSTAGGTHMDDLEAHSVNLVEKDGRLVWKDEVFGQFPFTPDPPPSEEAFTKLLHVVGAGAKDSNRIQVSFDAIAPTPEEFWSLSTTSELRVPIGRSGATRLQNLRLGKGVAQHTLIAGKTGSGKSTLLHAIITNLAMWYSPDEIELYLVDFKKGVEFKTYATHVLPHARAIAVESDREFGVSVLHRLDAELSRRGVLFRDAGVQDLASYRATPNSLVMPRTMLIIDEFQEFFSEDDKLAQDAGLLLDRLVRQGRAFGVHVLLGSQTIGGSGGLARSTISQMGVRVALQCSEADSQLILGDNNSAARLLSRPGEAIYNDVGGLVEGNSPFQIAWLPDEKRDIYLDRVEVRTANTNLRRRDLPVVFEGNAPADITKNQLLEKLVESNNGIASSSPPLAWLGDPVAIKEPTSVAFRRQSGANLLIIGQQEEQAMAMMSSAMISLSARHGADGSTFYVFDGSAADSPMGTVFARVKAALPTETKMIEWRAAGEAINALAQELARRQEGGLTDAPAIYVFIYGLQRYRILRKQEESFSFNADAEKAADPGKQFADLLREGPPLGIHVIAWADTPIAVDRTLDRNSMREFDSRILFQMSAADSSNLIDSPAANKLGFFRALIFSEEQGMMEKFRPYALPEDEWLQKVQARLAQKSPAGVGSVA